MSTYSNKFMIQLSDTARFIFQDEKVPIAKVLPSSIQLSAEVVMTIDNAKAFHRLLSELLNKI